MAKPLINDTHGNTWRVSADIAGTLLATFVASQSTIPLYMCERSAPETVYEVKILPNGLIGTFLVSNAKTHGASEVWLDTPDPTIFYFLQIKGGILQVQINQPFGTPLVAGQLYQNDGTTPIALQPGGIGTPVTMPVQTQGENLGLWVAGCGHWFTNWDIFSAQISGQTSALICCPVCYYIQRVITPYSLIHTDANMIIFA